MHAHAEGPRPHAHLAARVLQLDLALCVLALKVFEFLLGAAERLLDGLQAHGCALGARERAHTLACAHSTAPIYGKGLCTYTHTHKHTSTRPSMHAHPCLLATPAHACGPCCCCKRLTQVCLHEQSAGLPWHTRAQGSRQWRTRLDMPPAHSHKVEGMRASVSTP